MNNYNTKLKKWLKEIWDIEPINFSYYIEALTHKSYSNEHNLSYSYQRLEWLGDAVINMFVSNYLYHHYTNINEGELTILRAKIVQSDTEIMIAKQLKIQDYILFGQGVKKLESIDKVLEDCFESLIGAIYLDLGMEKIKTILNNILFGLNEKQILNTLIDYKSLVQQIFIKNNIKNTTYNTKQIGLNNFKTILKNNKIIYGIGQGHNKKIAEKLAAKQAYENLNKKEIK